MVLVRMLIIIHLTLLALATGFMVGGNVGFDLGKQDEIANEALRKAGFHGCIKHNGEIQECFK